MTPEQALEKVRTRIQEDTQAADIVRLVRSGAVDPAVAAEEIWDETDETLVQAIQTLANEVMTSLAVDSTVRQQALDQWGLSEEDLLFQPDPDRPTVMLNPLYQALIAEVLQFDGDLPELRTGPLPKGGTPAVPVLTQARSPIMLGAMLKTASETVAERLAVSEKQIRGELHGLVEMPEETKALVENRTEKIRELVQKPAAVDGYPPGQIARAIQVSPPTVREMLSLTLSEKQELFHKALTSTQGRRSAASVIGALVLDKIHKQGFSGVSLASEVPGEPAHRVEWTVSIDGGKGEVNPRFSYMDNAAGSLARQVLEKIRGQASRFTHLTLCVKPVNTVSESRVGWKALLFDD